MSAKSAEISSSAPPGCLWSDGMHHLQSRRLRGEGPRLMTLMSRLPGLPKGELQSLQRGVDGMCAKNRRLRTRPFDSPVRI